MPYSPLSQLLRDSRVAEFAWDGKGRPWRVRRNGHWATIDDVAPPDAGTVQDMVLSWWGMRFGRKESFPNHIVTATMVTSRGGWRYTFAPQSVSAWGSSLYVRRINPVISLQEGWTMPMQVSAFIKALLRARTSIIVAGRPASGKTTLLGGLVLALKDDERLGIVEVKHELVLPQDRHYVSWEVSEAAGDSLADLARQATQARFSRLVIADILPTPKGGGFLSFARLSQALPRPASDEVQHPGPHLGSDRLSQATDSVSNLYQAHLASLLNRTYVRICALYKRQKTNTRD